MGLDELAGFAKDVHSLPLTFEPGTGWQYGTGIDWAGTAIERVSGMSLDEYFQKHIFEPLGLKEMTLFPTDTMKSRLAYMHSKDNGKIRGRDHILHRSLIAEGDEIKDVFNSAGAGCFGKPVEYCGKTSTPMQRTNPTDTTLVRNPCHPPQRRCLPQDGQPYPPSLDGGNDVREPDPQLPQFRSSRNPRCQARIHQSSTRPLSAAEGAGTRVGVDVHVDDPSNGNR